MDESAREKVTAAGAGRPSRQRPWTGAGAPVGGGRGGGCRFGRAPAASLAADIIKFHQNAIPPGHEWAPTHT